MGTLSKQGMHGQTNIERNVSSGFMLFCLLNAALWSPAGKRLSSWLSCLWCFVVFCHFPVCCPGLDVVLDSIDS